MYIDVSFPRPSPRPRLGILVHWLPIDSVLLTEPLQYYRMHEKLEKLKKKAANKVIKA
jgi:hypothetical protein